MDGPKLVNLCRLALLRAIVKLRSEPGMQPLVSVTIPTYNRGELLTTRTLPSVLGQRWRNLEVIVVGDGCTDDTEQRLRALGDPRVRWVNLPRRGEYPEDPLHRWMVAGTDAANYALKLVRGEWISFVDDDDVVEPDHLEVLVGHALATGAEFVYGAGWFHRSPEEVIRIGGWPPEPGRVMHSAVVYRAYLRFLRYDKEAWREGIGGDAHLWRRMRALGVRMSFVDRVVCSSPLRPGEQLRGQRAAEAARALWVTTKQGS